jgi:hypothetical protein
MHIHYAILSSSAGTTSTIIVVHLSVGQNENSNKRIPLEQYSVEKGNQTNID